MQHLSAFHTTVLASILTVFAGPGRATPAAGPQQRGSDPPLEEGAEAPPGCWTTQGGAPARTGVSRSAAVLGDPVEAWNHGPAHFEGEPVVWGKLVLAAAKDSPNRRTLFAFELHTGRLLFHRRFTASVPLELSVWEDLIAVRLSEKHAELFRIRGSRLFPLRTFHNPKGVSAPLLFQDEIYVREGDDLVAYRHQQREPRWRARVEGGFRGTPSLRGAFVYGGWYDSAGNLHISAYDRRDGRRLFDNTAGHHGRSTIPSNAPLKLSIHENNIFVEYPYAARSTKDQTFAWGRLARGGGSTALHPFGTTPTPWAGGWIVKEVLGKRGTRWITARNDKEGLRARVLSDTDRQTWLSKSRLPATLTGDVAYFGPSAVTLNDYTIRWRRNVELTERPVPAGGYLLWVEKDMLRAMRAGAPAPNAAEQRASQLVDELESRLGNDLAKLADKALRAGDPGRAERLWLDAKNHGVAERQLAKTRAQLDKILSASRPPVLNKSKVRSVAKEETVLRDRPAAKLLAAARSSGDTALGRELLRRVLERDPEHPGAIQTIAGLVPDDFPRSRAPKALSWLEFLEVHDRNEVRYIKPPRSSRNLAPDQEALRLESQRWNKKVGGYRSERLLVITPPGRPGAVARSLEVGELVCDLLEELFGAAGNAGWNRTPPLTLLLYETRDEYIRQSQREKSGPEIALGWTAGHYSSGENLSRMYVPEGEATYDELLGVYAHELTHHWLDMRSPMSAETVNGSQSFDLPGYWIGEGFATLIEEFTLDPRRGTWNSENPRASSLDTVANAKSNQLLSWDYVLKASYADFTKLEPRNDRTIPVTWKLGVRSERSEIMMFYAQAGALCHYLYNAEDGRHRRALINYVGAWYRSDRRRLDTKSAFGMSSKKLGQRVQRYAQESIEDALSR